MKIIKSSLILVLIFTLILSLSCEKKQIYQKTSIAYFDTVITVMAYAETQTAFNTFVGEIFAEFARYHKLYDIYNEYDGMVNLCTVNKTAKDAPVEVDADIMALLTFGKEVHKLTNGYTNIAMGSVLTLWHQARKTETLPEHTLLTEAAKHTDIENMILDTENSTVYLADQNMCLDVGAIAKGYAAEQIAKALEEQGVSGVLLNVGGNIVIVGEGTPWSVAIQNPNADADTPYLQSLTLSSGALVTSGSYQRFFTVNGVRYHHIIDSQTLYPKNEFTLVSVLCPDSALADALSTALFNLSYEEGLVLIEKLNGTEALWQKADGTILHSSGFPAS